MKPTDCCPFCEAPALSHQNFSNDSMVDIVSKHACGTSSSEHHAIDSVSAPNFQCTELCIARQRLFDDVLARCLAAPRIESFYGNNPEPAIDTHELWTVELAIVRARAAVAARYPLPAKDAPDAN